MKKQLSLLAALLLLSVCTFAQQALWGGANIISPEINNDNTVTFRYLAPVADSVQLTGD
ncbi:MAG TPA: esterase, partial [Bacteroidales bacterium]|nr:esterase [Bacteroidales bacterium]